MTYTKIMKSHEQLTTRKEKPLSEKERCLTILYGRMEKHSLDVNNEVGYTLLDSECSIDPEASGVLSENQRQYIDRREVSFSKVDNPDARASISKFYKLEALSESELTQWMMKHWQDHKKFDKNAMVEMLVTDVIKEGLGENYIVVRSSLYDDYKNGVDNVILNKKTKEVVCAFDDVHDREKGDSIAEKNKALLKHARNEGVTLEHGIGIKDGAVSIMKLSNIMNYYIGITPSDMEDAIKALFGSDPEAAKKMQEKLFIKFTSAIIQQAEMLHQQEGISDTMKTKIEKDKNFFADIIENKKTGQ